MNRIVIVTFLSLLTLNVSSQERDENEIVWAKESDPVMVKAIKDARASLGGFFDRYQSKFPQINNYKLKVMITDEFGTEHFWVQPFKIHESGSFEGTLANEPRLVKSVKLGQLVSFKHSDISDWGYVENNKQYGSFTICALFKSMPEEQADYYRKNHGFQC